MERANIHLLRPAEVVELLGVSRSWLYEAAKCGRIPCVRLGDPEGPLRFRLDELENWIAGGRVATQSVDESRESLGRAGNSTQRPAPHVAIGQAELAQLRLIPSADG